MIDPTDVFPKQAHADKLRTDEDEKQGKQSKDPLDRPTGAVNQPHHKKKHAESHSENAYDASHNAQDTQRKGRHARQQIKLEIDQPPESVL